MRVSTYQQYMGYSRGIEDAQSRYLKAQREIMTGKKDDLMTNDPVAGSMVIRASGLKTRFEQYTKNLTSAKNLALTSEVSLGNMNDIMTKAKSLGLQGATSSIDQTSRDALATQVRTLRDRLVQEANTVGISGEYIFGGQSNGSKPYTVVTGTPDTLTFNGDDNSIYAEIGPNETMATNQTPSTLITNAFNALTALADDLTGGNISEISDLDLKDMDVVMDQVRQERGQIGAKLQSIAETSNRNTRRADELSAKISEAQDVDMSVAVSDLQLAQTAYQAALQVTAMGSKLSLMDYLR